LLFIVPVLAKLKFPENIIVESIEIEKEVEVVEVIQ
jgi:hypothetical protein